MSSPAEPSAPSKEDGVAAKPPAADGVSAPSPVSDSKLRIPRIFVQFFALVEKNARVFTYKWRYVL